MEGDGSAATAMLALAGCVLLAVSVRDSEVEQAVETSAQEEFCRGCGVAARLHNRRPTWVRDLPAGGRAVTLVWVKRMWRCVQPACPVRTVGDLGEHPGPRVAERAGPPGDLSAGRAGRALGGPGRRPVRVGWATAMAGDVRRRSCYDAETHSDFALTAPDECWTLGGAVVLGAVPPPARRVP